MMNILDLPDVPLFYIIDLLDFKQKKTLRLVCKSLRKSTTEIIQRKIVWNIFKYSERNPLELRNGSEWPPVLDDEVFEGSTRFAFIKFCVCKISAKYYSSTLSWLNKYSDRIISLDVLHEFDFIAKSDITFSCLENIKISIPPSEMKENTDVNYLAALLSKCSDTLETLEISDLQMFEHDIVTCFNFHLPSLRYLKVSHFTKDSQAIRELILRSCSNLITLEIENGWSDLLEGLPCYFPMLECIRISDTWNHGSIEKGLNQIISKCGQYLQLIELRDTNIYFNYQLKELRKLPQDVEVRFNGDKDDYYWPDLKPDC